jgi:hypothetical protein
VGVSENGAEPGACTVRACDVPCAELPEAPVMVRVYAVGDALGVVLTVSVELAVPLLEAVTVAGLKLQDTPATVPLEHDRLTEPENPPREVIATVEVAESPAATVAGENGVAEILKSLPDPNRGIDCGLPVSTARLATRYPPAAGVKVIFTVQLAPAAKEPPQAFV